MIFSSLKYGSGKNVPPGVTSLSFTELAIQKNQGYAVQGDQMGVTNLGKEWRYYKKELDTLRRKAKKDAERKARQQDSGHRGFDRDRDRGN